MSDTQDQPYQGQYTDALERAKQVAETTTDSDEIEEENANPNAGNESDGLSLSGDDELAKIAVARALGFDKISHLSKYDDQLQRIMNYSSMQGAKDINGIVAQVSELRNMLGRSATIYELSVYAGLAIEKNAMEKQMKKFHIK